MGNPALAAVAGSGASVNSDEIKTLQREIAKINARVGKIAGQGEEIRFGEFAQKYLESKKLNPTLRDSTKRSFEHQVANHLIPAFGSTPVDKITGDQWLSWVNETKEFAKQLPAGPGRVTRFFNARKYLNEILIAAKDAGHVERLPKLENPDQKRDVGRVLETHEILGIIWHAHPHFRFIFYTFWKTGCRPREILRWKWDMVRFKENGTAWVDLPAEITKTDAARSLPLNKALTKHLKLRFEKRSSPYVFPFQYDLSRPQLSYHGAWATACRRAGVKKAMAYDLRRTYITRCAAEGRQMLYVAKILGTSLKMIEGTYAKQQVDTMEEIVG